MRQIRKTDDEVATILGSVVRPYVEYRYLNIKASKTPNLLAARNSYWIKRRDAIVEGYKKAGQHEKNIADFKEWESKKKDFNPEDEK